MAGAELASGYISLSVKYKDSMQQISKDFAKVASTAGQSGTKAGQQFTQGVQKQTRNIAQNVGFGQVAGKAGAAGRQAGGAFSTGFLSGTKGLSSKVNQSLHISAPKQIAQAGNKAGGVFMGGVAAGLLKGGAVGVAATAVGALGAIFTAGFSRLESIDAAKAKLSGLGHSAAAVQNIMDSALASVKGTAFGLGDAANAAATAVAAGVKPGEQLTKYLKGIADAAAIAGTPLGEMASIFNKVQTNGVAMTDDLQQIADRGIPIFTKLAEHFGVTGQELKKMVEDGKVDAATFAAVMDKTLGGAALKMGNSFQGSVDNMKAAVGRLGASLLQPVFDRLPTMFAAIAPEIDKATAAIVAHQPEIEKFFFELGHWSIDAANVVLEGFGLIIGGIGQFLDGLGNLHGGLLRADAAIQRLLGNKDYADELDAQADAAFDWGTELKNAGKAMIEFDPTTMHAGLQQTADDLAKATADAKRLEDGINRLPVSTEVKVQFKLEMDQYSKDLQAWIERVHAGQDPGAMPTLPKVPGRRFGGGIGGHGNRDTIPAMLTPGEHVLTTRDVSAMGGQGAVYAFRNALHRQVGGRIPFGGGGAVNSEFTQLEQLALSMGLTLGSGRRDEPGSYHNTGEARDFNSPDPAKLLAFAQAVYSNYGGSLAELIFDAPGWVNNVKNGKNVGPFGQFYTMGQAGYHGDHVHVAIRSGTKISTPGTGDLGGGGGGEPTVPLTQTASGAWTSPNAAWAALIARESGGQNIRQTGVDKNSGGNEAEGIFQITPSTWKAYGGTEFAPNPLAATPQEQAIVAARILHGNPSGGDWGAGPGRENAAELLAGLTTTPGAAGGGGAGGAGGDAVSDSPYQALVQLAEKQKELDQQKAEAVKKILPDFGQLADIGVGGLKETLLPEGFSDPTEWKSVKSLGGLLGFLGGWIGGFPDQGAKIAGGLLSAAGAGVTGSGSGVVSAIEGILPQPFGNLPAGAPVDPGSLVGGGNAAPGIPLPGGMMEPTGPAPGPAVVNDQRIQIATGAGAVLGMNPTAVMDQGRRMANQQWRSHMGTKRP